MKAMTFDQFWQAYLKEHSKRGTQILHEAGSWIVVFGVVASVITATWWIAPAAVLAGYLCAFAGHFFIERNVPATFSHPLWAGIANWRVFALRLRRATRTLGGSASSAASIQNLGGSNAP